MLKNVQRVQTEEGEIMVKQSIKFITQISLIALFIIVGISTASWATTYYVAPTGNNGNPGTLAAPFQTIQNGLNFLQPGDTLMIRGGTYNEALVLKQSGTSTGVITIKPYTGETVTVSSGNSKVLRTNGSKHYYTIDGIRFISNHIMYGVQKDFTLDFGDGVWAGNNVPSAGNNNFILRNCYVEGAVYFYGHNNMVENCEFNGKSVWNNAINEAFGSSYNGRYRKNKVHDYIERGIWSMSFTSGVIIEDNTIYNIGNCGIDTDGAGHPVKNAIVRRNLIYKCGGRGIEMENSFNSIVDSNIVHDCDLGIHYINYGLNSPDFTSEAEFRTTPTNGAVINNLVYNSGTAGILLRATPSVKVYNNTVYKSGMAGKTFYGGIGLIKYGGYFPVNADIRNNIVSESGPYAVYLENTAAGIAGKIQMSNNIYYHSSKTSTHYLGSAYTLSGFMTATGQDSSSVFSNPNFKSASAFDFHLLTTSPAISKGMVLSAVTVDIEGKARGTKNDAGSYRFGVTPAAPKLSFAP